MDALNWRKASYSASNGGGCVEVGEVPFAILVRDTKDRTGPVLKFSSETWRRFADQVKRSLAPEPYWVRRWPKGGTLWCSMVSLRAYAGKPSGWPAAFLVHSCGRLP